MVSIERKIPRERCVVAVGPIEDLEARLLNIGVYDSDRSLVLEYNASLKHIRKLGRYQSLGLDDFKLRGFNGQAVYCLRLDSNHVNDTLLVRIGQYVKEAIINGTSNDMKDLRRKRWTRDNFYEPEFDDPNFFAEDIKIRGRFPTSDEEILLFKRFNWLRYKLFEAVGNLRREDNKFDCLERIGGLTKQILEMRDKITEYNLPLVRSALRKVTSTVNQDELKSSGNFALLTAVNKFDYKKGYKFSTYATGAILRAFYNTIERWNRHKMHYVSSYDPLKDKDNSLEIKRSREEAQYLEQIKKMLRRNKKGLNENELFVLKNYRFLLGDMTLESVGKEIGISKERVRQIQKKALRKLRRTLEEMT